MIDPFISRILCLGSLKNAAQSQSTHLLASTSRYSEAINLELAGSNNGGLLSGGDGTRRAAGLLNGHDGLEGLLISDLTEDDVLAIEPRGLLGGDEELRAVAVVRATVSIQNTLTPIPPSNSVKDRLRRTCWGQR